MRRRLGILEHNLSKRQAQILRAVVEAYVEGGEPVGSKYIAQTRMPNCSPATIRNEMAALEALGYLEQPHTSAGRIPSGAGYRFYVDCLADEYKKPAPRPILSPSACAANVRNWTIFLPRRRDLQAV